MSQKKTDWFRIYEPQQLANGRDGHSSSLPSLHKTDIVDILGTCKERSEMSQLMPDQNCLARLYTSQILHEMVSFIFNVDGCK